MEERMEQLTPNALHLADSDLQQIAETEKLPAAETVRLIARTNEKLAEIRKAETPTVIPGGKVIRSNRKRIRILGGLAAAVLSVTVLVTAVSGRMKYNKYMLERYFGAEGEANLAALQLPAQETVSNGIFSARTDAFLYDGHKAVALVTFETESGVRPIDWLGMMQGPHSEVFYYNAAVLDENGSPLGTLENPQEASDPLWTTGHACAWTKTKGSITAEITFLMSSELNTDHFTLRFSNTEYGILDVPVKVGKKLDTVTLKNASGGTISLSPIGLYADSRLPMSDVQMLLKLTGQNGKTWEAAAETAHSGKIPWADGAANGPNYTTARLYAVTDGMEYDSSKPVTYSAFLDVSGVTAAEWLGETYKAQ